MLQQQQQQQTGIILDEFKCVVQNLKAENDQLRRENRGFASRLETRKASKDATEEQYRALPERINKTTMPHISDTSTMSSPQLLRLQAERDMALADLAEARQDIEVMRANIEVARDNLNKGMDRMEKETRQQEKCISDAESRVGVYERRLREANCALADSIRECERRKGEIDRLRLLLVESEKSYGTVKTKIVEILSSIQ